MFGLKKEMNNDDFFSKLLTFTNFLKNGELNRASNEIEEMGSVKIDFIYLKFEEGDSITTLFYFEKPTIITSIRKGKLSIYIKGKNELDGVSFEVEPEICVIDQRKKIFKVILLPRGKVELHFKLN